MAMRTRALCAWLWGASAALSATTAVLTAIAWSELKPVDQALAPINPVASLLYASLGVLVVLRVANRIGWMLLAVAVVSGAQFATTMYAVVAVLTHPDTFPAGELVGMVSELLFLPLFVLLIGMLVLFPDGQLPSSRWRPVTAVIVGICAVEGMLFAVAPRSVGIPAPGGVSLTYDNPLALDFLGDFGRRVGSLNALAAIYLTLFLLALASLVARYRRGSNEVRRQILWLALVAGVSLGLQVVASTGQLVCECSSSPVTVVAQQAEGAVVLLGVPSAITVAILKYRLYQIDRILNRALVYGGLTIILGAVYLASVLLLQLVPSPITAQSDVAIAVSTLAAAALFRPARRRIQDAVDRRFYRSRYDATSTLDAFAAQLRHEVDLDSVARDLRAAVNKTWQPDHVTVWLRS
jgi:hypothetical protein